MIDYKKSVRNENLKVMMRKIQNEIKDKVISIFIDKLIVQNNEIKKLKKDCDRYQKKTVDVLKKLIKIEDEKEKKLNLSSIEKLNQKLTEIDSSFNLLDSNEKSNSVNKTVKYKNYLKKKDKTKFNKMKLINKKELKKNFLETTNENKLLYSSRSINQIKYFNPNLNKKIIKSGSQDLKLNKNNNYNLFQSSNKKKLKNNKNLSVNEDKLSRNNKNNSFKINDSNSIEQNSTISFLFNDNVLDKISINKNIIDSNTFSKKNSFPNLNKDKKVEKKNFEKNSEINNYIPRNIRINVGRNNKKQLEMKINSFNNEKYKTSTDIEKILINISENNKKGIKTNPLYNTNLYNFLEKFKK